MERCAVLYSCVDATNATRPFAYAITRSPDKSPSAHTTASITKDMAVKSSPGAAVLAPDSTSREKRKGPG